MARLKHQVVTGILRSAGFVARNYGRGEFNSSGYSTSQHNGRVVAVLCGTINDVHSVRLAIESAGLTVVTRPNTSSDCLFVMAG